MEGERDEKLVEACLRGESRAYTELAKRYARRLYAVCLAIVGRAVDAEDLTQETLVKGFTELASLKDHGKFAPWITAIALNLSRDALRERAVERGCSVRAAERGASEPASPVYEPEKIIDLRWALLELPEQHRIPLLLYYFDGHSTESVAATLDISPAAVHQRLCRARRELRKLLETDAVRHE